MFMIANTSQMETTPDTFQQSTKLYYIHISRGWSTFSIMDQIANILGFVVSIVSITTLQV